MYLRRNCALLCAGALVGIVGFPTPSEAEAEAKVKARVWPNAAAWEADMNSLPKPPNYQIVWNDLWGCSSGENIDNKWVPYGPLAGVWFRKTSGRAGLVNEQPGLYPMTDLVMMDGVSFIFGEPLRTGGDIWYEPLMSFGLHVYTDQALLAEAFGTSGDKLGEWTIEPHTQGIWGVVADDYIIGKLVITEKVPPTTWPFMLPIVIGARVPEPATLSLLALAPLAVMRRRRPVVRR